MDSDLSGGQLGPGEKINKRQQRENFVAREQTSSSLLNRKFKFLQADRPTTRDYRMTYDVGQRRRSKVVDS